MRTTGSAIGGRVYDYGEQPLSGQVRAYIGVGVNVGDARTTLEHAVAALSALPGVRLRAVSPLYRTKPVGGIEQPDYLNAVVGLDVPAGPDPATGALALLAALKQLELAIGRKPREHWGPREIDLDLLIFGRHQIRVGQPRLEVPHPEMHSRLFVLAPLSEITPGLRPPGWHETVATARERLELGDGATAVRRLTGWSFRDTRWI